MVIKCSLQKTFAICDVKLWLFYAVLPIRPTKSTMNQKAQISCEDSFLPIAKGCQPLQQNHLLHCQRWFLSCNLVWLSKSNPFHSCRLQDGFHIGSNQTLGKTQGLKKSCSFWRGYLCCPEVTQVVVRHFLTDRKNSTHAARIGNPLPPAKWQEWGRPCPQCRSRFIAESIWNHLPNVVITASKFNALHQKLSKVRMACAVKYNDLPTLKSNVELLVLWCHPWNFRQMQFSVEPVQPRRPWNRSSMVKQL